MTSFAFQPPIATKLFPSRSAGDLIARPRLAAPPALLAGAPLVVTVVGPAGYGKSTLMACWAELLSLHAMHWAWLTLDEDDDDPARLVAYLSESLRGRGMGPPRVAPAPPPAQLTLEHLSAQLAAIDMPFVLFLDDLHTVSSQPALQVIEWIVLHSPSTVRVVIGSRGVPRLRLNPIRMRGQLSTIDAAQLRFDAEEGQRFLRTRLGATLEATTVDKLVRYTEGWPAGMQLATLTLTDTERRSQMVEGFVDTPRDLIDYLSELLTDQFDEDTRAFVFTAAHFPRVCGDLLIAATGFSDARERLLALHRGGLFLVALDAENEWFRFHHLVGRYFLSHLKPSGHDAQRTLGAPLRGAQWLQAQGLVAEAIGSAIEARAWEQACSWLSDCIEQRSLLGSVHLSILRWLKAIPEAWVDRYPRVLAYGALALTSGHRSEESDRQFARLEACLSRLEQSPDAPPREAETLRRTVQAHRAIHLCTQEHSEQALQSAVQWLERWPDAPPLERGLVQTALSYGTLFVGKPHEAQHHAHAAQEALTQTHDPVGLAWHRRLEVLLAMSLGDYRRARECSERSAQLLLEQLGASQGEISLFHTVQALVAYEFDELATARFHLEAGETNTHGIALAATSIIQPTLQARLLFRDGSIKGALATLHTGQSRARDLRLESVEIALVGEECIWLCRLGRHAEAARIAAAHPQLSWRPVADPQTLVLWASLQPVSIRIRMRQEPAEVAALLTEALPAMRAIRKQLPLVKMLVLHAAAMDLKTQRDAVLEALAEAARIGSSQGYKRVFIDDAPLLQPLLDALRAPELEWIDAALRSAPTVPTTPQVGHHETLTQRELIILKKLDTDLANKAIAESLFISEGTLKWHLHNVYGKLNVRSRPGARARARALNLL